MRRAVQTLCTLTCHILTVCCDITSTLVAGLRDECTSMLIILCPAIEHCMQVETDRSERDTAFDQLLALAEAQDRWALLQPTAK